MSVSLKTHYKSYAILSILMKLELLAALILALCTVGVYQSVVNAQPRMIDESYTNACIALAFSPHVESPEVLFHGDRSKNKIALTFDADMTPAMAQMLKKAKVASWYNRQVIDILEKSHTKATLFLTGMWIEEYQHDTEELAQNELFELASHSYSHPGFYGKCYGLIKVTDDQKPVEIAKATQIIEEASKKHIQYFRFPGGCYSASDLALLKKYELTPVQWDVAAEDGFNRNVRSMVSRVLSSVQNGSIIVMHMHGGPYAPDTAAVLAQIIPALKERGYEFVKISELEK